MQDNRNNALGNCLDGRGTVCISTMRVLDCCRDRDCFEDVRVYLTTFGEEILETATNIRTKGARIIWTYVGVDEVPFNCGFYRITIRYYILLDFEACVAIGRSQTFTGIATVEKDVILYGGEGSVTTYSSSPENDYCAIGTTNTVGTNAPTAVVEAVEPIVLGTKVKECIATPNCDCIEIPDCVRCCIDGEITGGTRTQRLYVSLGIFSVVRIERPAQLLVQATDYSVPDKECFGGGDNDDNPCEMFRTMAFPISRFRGTVTPQDLPTPRRGGGGCGCKGNNT